MSQRVIYLEGHVRQTLPLLVELPDDFNEEGERLSLAVSLHNAMGDTTPFDFWQPFNTKIEIGKEGKPALKVTRLKEEECQGHVRFKVEKMKHE